MWKATNEGGYLKTSHRMSASHGLLSISKQALFLFFIKVRPKHSRDTPELR